MNPSQTITGGSTMDGLLEVKNVSVSIRRPPKDVYAFVSDGKNVPRWAAGLGTKIRRSADEWIAEGGPLGAVRVRFTPPNELGIADHDVTLDTGVTIHNPIRVIPNGAGSTLIFTVLRQPDVSPQQFDEDAKTVEKDLTTLKAILEQQ
jgi:hypothetical protein